MAKQPHLLVEEGDVHEIAIIPGDPGRVDRIADLCDDSELVAQNREYKIVNASYDGTDLTICSTGIGCPSAAIAVEELSRVGVETFLRCGTCGALQADMEVGDMVVATGAAKEEGTSKRYESVEYPAVPDYDALTELVGAAEDNDEEIHVGPIVSDDAFTTRATNTSTTGTTRTCSRSRWRRRPSSRSHAARGSVPARSAPSTATSSRATRRAQTLTTNYRKRLRTTSSARFGSR